MTNHFGVDTSKLAHTDPNAFTILPTVKGRTLQIDADFLAYQVSYDDEKSISEMRSNCDTAVERMRLSSGSEFVCLHLTPQGSNKGMRYELAMLKEYQANRAGKPKPKMLHVIREWMHKERGAILHMNCEADDGMAMAQYKAIREGNRDLSIIASKDKDLCIVPGLQINWDTGEITDTGDDDFGWITMHVSESKSKTKKIKGRGWKFFWAQMLTGDTADNIHGLPKVCHPKYVAKDKFKAVGPVMAYDILAPVKTNKEAFQLVRDLFKSYGEKIGFVNYRDGKPIPFGEAFRSEAQLLWMRRNDSHDDCLDWMKEHCI